MSEPMQVNLTRAGPGQSWGFRLQGGSDFTTALSIQSVNPGSIAEQHGLCPGDNILQIGNQPTDRLEHEQAKQLIVASGNTVNMVVQRGSVKVWQPKVTPMSELKSGPGSVPSQGPSADSYVQKTSLAADKQEGTKINFFNRTARGFPGASGSGAGPAPGTGAGAGGQGGANPTVPVIMNNQYNSPMGMYSANSALEAFDQQSQSLVGNMDSLSVSDNNDKENNNTKEDTAPTKPSEPAPTKETSQLTVGGSSVADIKRGPSPTFLAIHSDDPPVRVRSQSPAFMKVLGKYGDDTATQRSMSPTMQALQQEDLASKGRRSPVSESAVYSDTKEGEEIRYHGYTNPNKQSRSFRMLQQELGQTEGQAPAPQAAPASGVRSVKAPTGPPPNVQVQQAQHMTCKGCGSLIVGVFVRIKGDPMHPECFKCANCGKNLKNKGHFTVAGSLFCEDCATSEAPPPGPNMTATAVYR